VPVTGEVIDQSSRWRILLDALSIHKRVSVTEAAELLGVSAATVRRDFKELARQQLATRTHGGVVATTVAYDRPRDIASPPATRVSGSLVPRPSWSGPARLSASTAVRRPPPSRDTSASAQTCGPAAARRSPSSPTR
jgi:DNA-binding Lrp family transcriptional regulator